MGRKLGAGMGLLGRVSRAYYRLRGHVPVQMRHLSLRCDADHYSFWRKVSRGAWEPGTFEILARFLTPQSVYCDVGAWIGPTVLFAARLCKLVYCFEPDVVAYEYLLHNLRLNGIGNVIPFNVAVGQVDGLRVLASRGKRLGDSTSSLLEQPAGKERLLVPCLSWDTLQESFGLGKVDFLKLDVEGAEYELLPALAPYLARHRPTLHLSTHAPYLPEVERPLAMSRLAEVVSAIYPEGRDESSGALPPDWFGRPESLNEFRTLLFAG